MLARFWNNGIYLFQLKFTFKGKVNQNHTVLVPIYFHCMDKKYNEIQNEPKLFGYPHSSKSLLSSVEHKSQSYWFVMTGVSK